MAQKFSELLGLVSPEGAEILGEIGRSKKLAKRGADGPPPDRTFFMPLRLLVDQSPFSTPYSQHPWVYAANSARAKPLSQVPYRIYKEAKKLGPTERVARAVTVLPRMKSQLQRLSAMPTARERMMELRRLAPWLDAAAVARAAGDVEVVETGEWYELFRKPNPEITRAQLWEATFLNLGLEGNAFWRLLNKKGEPCSDTEVPVEIWPYSKKGWKPLVDPDTKIISAWKQTWGAISADGIANAGEEKTETLPLSAVVFWRYFNPYHPIWGLSPLSPLRADIESDFYAVMFNLAFFKSGAHVGGYIYSERALTPQQKKDLLQQFEERHGGSRKAHRPDVFEGGLKFVPIDSKHKDMDFVKLRDKVRDTILSVYRVPRSMVGLNEDVNRASMEQGAANFWEVSLIPEALYAEDLLDSHLFTEKRAKGSIWGAFDFSVVDALQEDMAATVDVAKGLQALGYTINEINQRLELGMEEQPWGDTWYRTSTLVPVNEKEEAPDPDDAVDKDKGKDGKTPPGKNEKDDEVDDDEDDDAEDKAAQAAALAKAPPKQTARAVENTEDVWERLHAKLFAPAEDLVERKFGRFLHELRKAQLKLIEENADVLSTLTVPDSLLFPLTEWQTKAAEAIDPVWKRVRVACDEEMASTLSKSVAQLRDAQEEEDYEVLMQLLVNRIGMAVATVRKTLRALFAELILEGTTVEKLQERVRYLFNRFRSQGRVATVARVMSGSFVNGYREIQMRAAAVDQVEWVTAQDELVRDNHIQYGNAGMQPRGVNWATILGYEYVLEFPHDGRAPAGEVINCRCALVPVS
jgi:HK97 family phage portal protein